ncbi:MAG: Na+/H+ antiporter NhaA [Candidatus Nanopelagicales bacterium]
MRRSAALLIIAAAIALVWANSPAGDLYYDLANFTVGPSALHLNLTLATWAADGLLAIFFFVAGLELKYELVKGSLSRPSQAAVPRGRGFGRNGHPGADLLRGERQRGRW